MAEALFIVFILTLPGVLGFALGKLPGKQGLLAQLCILLLSIGIPSAAMLYLSQEADAIDAAAAFSVISVYAFVEMVVVCVGYRLSGRRT